jgi:excisionase family DNA binding protein
MVTATIESLPALMTRPEAAAFLRVSKPTLSRWAKTGRLKPLKLGGSVRYEKDAVQRLLDAARAAEGK